MVIHNRYQSHQRDLYSGSICCACHQCFFLLRWHHFWGIHHLVQKLSSSGRNAILVVVWCLLSQSQSDWPSSLIVTLCWSVTSVRLLYLTLPQRKGTFQHLDATSGITSSVGALCIWSSCHAIDIFFGPVDRNGDYLLVIVWIHPLVLIRLWGFRLQFPWSSLCRRFAPKLLSVISIGISPFQGASGNQSA